MIEVTGLLFSKAGTTNSSSSIYQATTDREKEEVTDKFTGARILIDGKEVGKVLQVIFVDDAVSLAIETDLTLSKIAGNAIIKVAK